MVRNLEQPRNDGALLAQSRTLRITAQAVCTHLAIAVFALLDARTAAHHQVGRALDAELQRHLFANIEKAKELGAETVRIRGKDPVEAILEFARSHNVGHIIVGRSQQAWWKQLLGRSIPLRLVREAAQFDIHIVSLEDEVTG